MNNRTVTNKKLTARERGRRFRLSHSLRIASALLVTTVLAFAQSEPPRYETVSIKPSAPATSFSSSPFPGGRFTARGMTAGLLLQYAFGVQGADLVGVPDWVKNDLFDVDAVPAASFSRDQIPLAIRGMLEDRFKLVTHFSDVETAGYNLVLAGHNSKLKIADERAADEKFGMVDSEFQLSARDVAVTDLCRQLTNIVGKPVVDRTNLRDRYDFILEWDRHALQGTTPPSNPVAGVTIFSALEAQLGLKPESSQVAHRLVVIDHIEKPTPN